MSFKYEWKKKSSVIGVSVSNNFFYNFWTLCFCVLWKLTCSKCHFWILILNEVMKKRRKHKTIMLQTSLVAILLMAFLHQGKTYFCQSKCKICLKFWENLFLQTCHYVLSLGSFQGNHTKLSNLDGNKISKVLWNQDSL